MKRANITLLLSQDLDFENNKEVKKLKFLAPGPKMADAKPIKPEPGTPVLSFSYTEALLPRGPLTKWQSSWNYCYIKG